MNKLNRIEIISERGREYVKQLSGNESFNISYQDDDQTLKIILVNNPPIGKSIFRKLLNVAKKTNS